MLRDGDSNSTRQSGVGVDLESNEKTSKRSISKISCIVIFLMALAVIATLVVFLVSSPRLLDKETRCFNQNEAFHNYKLFSTKTLYNTALDYIGKTATPTSLPLISVNPSQPHYNDQHESYDKSSVNVPKIFAGSDTLESIHKRMTSELNCTIAAFHFFGRHAARTPDDEDIESLASHMAAIRSRISVPRPKPDQSPSSSASSSSSGVTKTGAVNASGSFCLDPLAQLDLWKDFVSPGQGNMVTEAGERESVELASRLRKIYPELFDGSRSKIKFGTTTEIRTAQTAVSFLKQMVNYTDDKVCELDQFPAANTQDKSKSEAILKNSCLKKFLDKHKREDLQFHKECNRLKSGDPFGPKFGLQDANKTTFIAEYVSEQLRLTDKDKLTSEQTRAIYDVCRYDSAQLGITSIWCSFFKDEHLKFYEYMADVAEFYNEAYGHTQHWQSSCAVTKDLMDSLSDLYNPGKRAKPEANFYFTHSSVIQKLIAASISLEEDAAYKQPTVRQHLAAGTVPKDRQWQSSLLSPFSANIAFTTYDCRSPTQTGPISSKSQTPFRLVASLNEQPILLTGCSNYDCELSEVKLNARLFEKRQCSMSAICKDNFMVT